MYVIFGSLNNNQILDWIVRSLVVVPVPELLHHPADDGVAAQPRDLLAYLRVQAAHHRPRVREGARGLQEADAEFLDLHILGSLPQNLGHSIIFGVCTNTMENGETVLPFRQIFSKTFVGSVRFQLEISKVVPK